MTVFMTDHYDSFYIFIEPEAGAIPIASTSFAL